MNKLLIFTLCLGLWGCSHSEEKLVMENVEISDQAKIGVLPFDNLTDRSNAGRIIAEAISFELQREGFKAVVAKDEERDPQAVSKSEPKNYASIAQTMAVTHLLIGTVSEYQYKKVKNIDIPSVSIKAKIIDANTGEVIWNSYASAEKEGISLDALTHDLVEEFVDEIDSDSATSFLGII